MPNRFDTEGTPFLFSPHSEGELDEYFSCDHEKSVSAVAKDVIASLSESRDSLSGEVWYDFCYNQRRYKLTLMKFADTIVRAVMFCANCYKEIPAGKSYYKHQDTNQSYCSLDCLNDHMIYTHSVTLETSEGEERVEVNDDDE